MLALLWGRFRTAPIIANYYVVYLGNTPENHPPTEACMIIHNSIGGAEFRTPGPVASIRLKKKILGVLAGAVGCRIQDLGAVATGGEKQPTFRTVQAQRACTAHGAPPLSLII